VKLVREYEYKTYLLVMWMGKKTQSYIVTVPIDKLFEMITFQHIVRRSPLSISMSILRFEIIFIIMHCKLSLYKE
jgi:hypothetical protein